jgi:hypothetical protein
VEELRAGSQLLAFDENAAPGRGLGRRWRWATVEANILKQGQSRYAVTTEHGVVMTTPNHLWLVIGKNTMQRWKRTDQLEAGDELIRVVEPWDDPKDFESGWLSGFTDGEGSLVLRRGRRNPNVTGIYLVQNPGAVIDQAHEWLLAKRFDVRRYRSTKVKAEHLRIIGGFSEHLRFLGQLRPIRLLEKFASSERNEKFMVSGITRSRVQKVHRVSDGSICTLQTSTGTFIAEGYAMHNTFIVDAHAGWFLSKNADLAPRWFRRAISRLDTLPAPPPPLAVVISTARGEE